jgi:SAM-dependent methyltransferase
MAEMPKLPRCFVAAESWRPNLSAAAARLRPLGAHVVAADATGPWLPLRSGSFDLVTSRHPVAMCWPEVARLLKPGGTFLSQQVGLRSVAELSEVFLGPLPPSDRRSPSRAVAEAGAAGLDVVDLREASLRVEFHDIGAVVYFLRLVVWIVPGFSVDRYMGQLRALHEAIVREGPFVATATRFLIEATKPVGASPGRG